MCGLAGYIIDKRNADNKTIQAFRGLLLAMEERGNESTGIAYRKGRGINIIKSAKPASSFIADTKFFEMLEDRPNLVIGHTRLATTGKVKKRNAHPFRAGDVVGCHNGHVWNWERIAPKSQVDSEAIFEAIKENGEVEGLNLISGDVAVTYLIEGEPEVRLARNTNPLFLAVNEDMGLAFWASEEEALDLILRAVYGSVPFKIERIKPYSLAKLSWVDGKLIKKETELYFATYYQAQKFVDLNKVIPTHAGASHKYGTAKYDALAEEYLEAQVEWDVLTRIKGRIHEIVPFLSQCEWCDVSLEHQTEIYLTSTEEAICPDCYDEGAKGWGGVVKVYPFTQRASIIIGGSEFDDADIQGEEV